MITYEIPEEPKEGPLWGPSDDGESWVEYWRSGFNRLWYDPKKSAGGNLTWGELLLRGPLVDEDPRITLEDLADQVLGAAMTWQQYRDESQPLDRRSAALDDLSRALRKYRNKLESR
jgi:hypothetical protein